LPDYSGWLDPPKFAMYNKTMYPMPTPVDSTWTGWTIRTGELPPDFGKMPSLPLLPDPLIIDEGGQNIRVNTYDQWLRKREWLKEQTQYWITGKVPPPPGNIEAELLGERMTGDFIEREILLKFGPEHKGRLHISLLIPPGTGPFPVIVCQWIRDRYVWLQEAVRRGYIGVRYRATEPAYGYPDDSEEYAGIWWPEYDFSTLMRWGWAASRAIDYLYTLPIVNRDQIALTGLSRNGKMALWAAAHDERIKAVVPVSGGTGGENPFRYTTERYNTEPLALSTTAAPHWYNPRLRFFVGRESKLPVDQNSLMALIAPRGLMITSSITEHAGNPWGIEQAYLSAKKVYDFLGAGDNIALDLRDGLHAPAARDMERYIDFFDYIFKRGNIKPAGKLYYDYSFSKWMNLSGVTVDPMKNSIRGIDDLLEGKDGQKIRNSTDWKIKREDILDRIREMLGEAPPEMGRIAYGVHSDYLTDVIGPPQVNRNSGNQFLSFGRLFYPLKAGEKTPEKDLPVMIYLHEYSYSRGSSTLERGQQIGDIINRFNEQGFAVYVFDQIGFGTRIEEGRLFYERFPRWSKMGRMVEDVRSAIGELSEIDFLNKDKIFIGGYSLGGTIGLYCAALDNRIAGVISACGFSPMRLDIPGKTAEGIYCYSHLHGLIPRLGFFIGNENRIPYDFHEILALIAPRPLLVIAPSWDQYASQEDVKKCVSIATAVYDLYDAKKMIQIHCPDDYGRLTVPVKDKMMDWVRENFNDK
jgi:dienelactone hydrolase